ncbi:MAG: hypothetical protein A2086_11560 [Spirochaetes bacterium GWD1_27_9]|nr:MAG: hypothetical protein A2Z98_04685 [Spirochaetes bacterium GWB1_27_13]OHD21935.1 MAG: hypothetical protein A2Y34_05380 [Spirochaetes bacterium GWC1_27_15]OHD36565.1 MAG: hypothetical protein A2086_11560 [Spirochaetes bacterium GWD1_27_9]
MKRLILMRHAKSDRDTDTSDFERPLAKRGIDEAPLMGKFLRKEKLIPDLIVCSPAKRAKETLELVVKEFKQDVKIEFDKDIYDKEEAGVINIIRDTKDKIDTLMVVGHNPTLESLLYSLISDMIPYDKFGTSGVGVIDFDIKKWSDIEARTGKLVLIKTPKLI